MPAFDAKIPFFLVTGFLGSGKTTFVQCFIEAYAPGYRIAVIQNEFAPINIDGRHLSNSTENVKVIEMNNGSVFCVCLLPDFKSVLADLIKQDRYDAILLEPTGLADPIAINQLFHDPYLGANLYAAHVWTLVDAAQMDRMLQIKSAERQIRLADTVLLNKMDLYAGNPLELSDRIHNLNPLAVCECTRYGEIALPTDLLALSYIPVADKKLSGIPARRPNVGTAVIREQGPATRATIESFLQTIGDAAFRIKGTVRLHNNRALSVQVAIQHRELDEISGVHSTELVLIGPGIEQGPVHQLWQDAKVEMKTVD